jgi:hypothetical protein
MAIAEACRHSPASALEHDPENRVPVSVATTPERIRAEIMLEQEAEIMIRCNLVGS